MGKDVIKKKKSSILLEFSYVFIENGKDDSTAGIKSHVNWNQCVNVFTLHECNIILKKWKFFSWTIHKVNTEVMKVKLTWIYIL